MTGCTESSLTLLQRELDGTIERLVPAVESMLQTLAPAEVVVTEPDEGGQKLSVPLHFPDGIGRGQAIARVFRYRDYVRVDFEIAHNRMFARPDGTPSDRRCFLNDFVASVSIQPKGELPAEFRRYVVSGVHAARDAVQRHNRGQTAPWNQVSVVEG
jgi:hypothetical protein